MRIGLIWMLAVIISNTAQAQNYQLVWEDNFDGNSLDSSTWNVVEKIGIWNTGQNAEMQFYLTENVSVGDDGFGNNCLIIKTIKEDYNGYSFTSGRINTDTKFSFKFGKLEARIKIPDLKNGLWPAYWTEGYNTLSWPAKGEIDIMEMGHKDGIDLDKTNSYVSSATHWESGDNRADYSTHIIASENLSNDYHTYTLEWTPTSIKTYLDGTTQIFSFNLNGNDLEEYKDYANFIILNMAVGGILPGITNPAGITAPLPSEMFVDYIRLYQIEGQEDFNINPHVIEGSFGVFTESVTPATMNVEFDGEIITSGLDEISSVPDEGYKSLAYAIQTDQDFDLSINSYTDRNLSKFSMGSIIFSIKTDCTEDLMMTIQDKNGQSASLTLDNTKTYNPARDNKWNLVSVPIADFTGIIDFSVLRTVFGIGAVGSPSSTVIELDKIYWEEEYSGPINTNYYGLFAEHEDITDKIDFASTGHIYVWNGFTGTTGIPYYGEKNLAFNANAGTWNGFAIQSDIPIDFSGYIEGNLNLALKSTSTNEFNFGIQNMAGHSWERSIAANANPSYFKRDGNYYFISIPLKQLTPSSGSPALSANELTQVTIPFKLIGTINFSIDEIFLSKDATIPEYGIPGVNVVSVTEPVIYVYPVPAKNQLNTRGILVDSEIMILSLDGRFIERFRTDSDLQLDLGNYAPGMYLMKIYSKQGSTNTYFIVE